MSRYGQEAQRATPLDGRCPSLIDVAYWAGLFDGEGSIDVSNGTSPRLKVSMTDEPTIRWIEATFGGKVHAEKPSGCGRLPAWRWYLLKQSDVRHLLELAMPFLITKQQRGQAALDVLNMYMTATADDYRSDAWKQIRDQKIERVYARYWKKDVTEQPVEVKT